MGSKTAVLEILSLGEILIEGEFLWGSNFTFLGSVTLDQKSLKCVYKPTKGERPLWDFPPASLAKREVAAFIVSEAIGWKFVPPTVFREDGPLGPGSLQLFIEHEPEYHYFSFDDKDRSRLRPVVLFDYLINNADRKGSHIIIDEDNKMWLIDHGLCFHIQDKLRTVIWEFAGETIPDDLMADVANLCTLLQDEPAGRSHLIKDLAGYLSFEEINCAGSSESLPVKHEAMDAVIHRDDIIPVGEGMRPEGRPVGMVQLVDIIVVPLTQPFVECCITQFAMAIPVVFV